MLMLPTDVVVADTTSVAATFTTLTTTTTDTTSLGCTANSTTVLLCYIYIQLLFGGNKLSGITPLYYNVLFGIQHL